MKQTTRNENFLAPFFYVFFAFLNQFFIFINNFSSIQSILSKVELVKNPLYILVKIAPP